MISKINIGGTKMAIQDKFNKQNTIYKITKDIDLGGGALTIPYLCLRFSRWLYKERNFTT